MRYLDREQLTTLVSLGKPVEQWLTPVNETEYIVLRWLRIALEKGKHVVEYTECFDDGDADFIDISEFSPLHPDDPVKLDYFDTVAETLSFVEVNYDADLGRFISNGMIQEEYESYLKSIS